VTRNSLSVTPTTTLQGFPVSINFAVVILWRFLSATIRAVGLLFPKLFGKKQDTGYCARICSRASASSPVEAKPFIFSLGLAYLSEKA
jgi:hypothetical protein